LILAEKKQKDQTKQYPHAQSARHLENSDFIRALFLLLCKDSWLLAFFYFLGGGTLFVGVSLLSGGAGLVISFSGPVVLQRNGARLLPP